MEVEKVTEGNRTVICFEHNNQKQELYYIPENFDQLIEEVSTFLTEK